MAWIMPLSTSGAGTALNLINDDNVFVADGIFLGSTGGYGITAGGDNQEVIVHGTVAGVSAVRLIATLGTDITIGETGHLVSTQGETIIAEGMGTRIYNHGLVENLGNGAAINFTSFPGSGFQELLNTGRIEGTYGIVLNGSGAATVNNSGIIDAPQMAYEDKGTFKDEFINTGSINGGVSLGGGDDLYDSRVGTQSGGWVEGGAGNDRLYAGAGKQFLDGNEGDDMLMGGAGADTLQGGDDVDTASYASAVAGVKASLSNAASNTGDAKGDTYLSIERLVGSKFADTLVGNSGANGLVGEGGADILTGGDGTDRFLFTKAPTGMSGADHVTDFATDFDELRLDDAAFEGLALGNLSGDAFWASAAGTAHDATDRVIYEADTGWLRFDADGAGGAAAVAFAKLAAGLTLGADDVFVY